MGDIGKEHTIIHVEPIETPEPAPVELPAEAPSEPVEVPA